MIRRSLLTISLFWLTACANAVQTSAPVATDWSANAQLPESGERRDIYHLGDGLADAASRGLRHIVTWPVTVSGVLLPWRPIAVVFDPKATSPDVLQLQAVGRAALGFGTIDEMYGFLGLSQRDAGVEAFAGVPWPTDIQAGDFLGAGTLMTSHGPALTFSCATCHVARFFGKTIVGMTNRHSRANVFFGLAKQFFPAVTDDLLVTRTQATPDELALMDRAQANLPAVGYKEPRAHGLDTSLAQVALSLARRQANAWATRDPTLEQTPRPNDLETYVADSKPAVWWSLKYKTRWLSDGSIVSGNPVFTNFLWNELGRGTDLHELNDWLAQNQATVDELTALVFANTPPRWQDVFAELPIDVTAAARGKVTFDAICATCHGTYDKAFDGGDTRTRAVHYHKVTPVLDVGTDPQRAKGMAAFATGLNQLAISQAMGTVVAVQTGYVPPPLEGIFVRYPYLHNQSVPTLCELLRPAKFRSAQFWLGPDVNVATDFDPQCVGLPVGKAIPAAWQTDPQNQMDTTQPGLSNQGHEAFLLDANGNEVLHDAERKDLIEFLKTL